MIDIDKERNRRVVVENRWLTGVSLFIAAFVFFVLGRLMIQMFAGHLPK